MSQMSDVVRLGREAAWTLAHGACRGAGASEVIARSLADAIVAAEWAARPSVGLAHLRDYLAGFTSGRIATNVEPEFDDPALAVIRSDAKGGIAQLGFGEGADPGTELRAAARFDLVRGVEEGWLRVVVAETYPLEQAADAHRAMVGAHGAGKIVLVT